MSDVISFSLPPSPFNFLSLPVYRAYTVSLRQFNAEVIRHFSECPDAYEYAMKDRKGTQASTRWNLCAILEHNLNSVPSAECKRQKGGSSFITEFPEHNIKVCYGKAKPDLTGFVPKLLRQLGLWGTEQTPPTVVVGSWVLKEDLTIGQFLFVEQANKAHMALDLSLFDMETPTVAEPSGNISMKWKNPPKANDEEKTS